MPDSSSNQRPIDEPLSEQLLSCGACGKRFPWLDATAVRTSEGLLPICPSCMSLANRS